VGEWLSQGLPYVPASTVSENPDSFQVHLQIAKLTLQQTIQIKSQWPYKQVL
jgi:hypothetical protein